MGRTKWESDQLGVGGQGWTTEKKGFIPGPPNPSGPSPRKLSKGCHLFYDRVPRTASGLRDFGTGAWEGVSLGINLKVG